VARRDDPAALVAEAIASLPAGVSADARLTRHTWTTIRFANGRIHQPHLERTTRLSLRVAEGGRLGIATSTDLTSDGIRGVLRTARALAHIAPVEPKFPGFPREGSPRPATTAFSAPTAALGPDGATRLAERAIAAAREGAPDGRIAGVVNVGAISRRVLNSTGLDRGYRSSAAEGSLLVDRPDRDPPVSGWSEGAHWDASRLDPDRIGREAAERVARTAPTAVKPGAYRVLLRGEAVSEALVFLSTLGFGGNGEVQGWSCLHRLRGKRIAPEFVHLVDDARSRDTLPAPVDAEGVAARATPLLDHGVVGPPVTDTVTSGRLGRPLTGHALSPESPSGDMGPFPTHLLLSPGDASEEEMIRATRRGLLVTRFHYVRVVDPGRGVITGMTRDGTYRIDHGEIVGPARNLRFTDSVVSLLRGAELLGRSRRMYADERGGLAMMCPAILTGSFRFTSATLF
jgi:PmbA protein